MACGCNKRRSAPSTAAAQPSARGTIYSVYVGGSPTGRRFTSVIAAESYAARVGGEVRAE